MKQNYKFLPNTEHKFKHVASLASFLGVSANVLIGVSSNVEKHRLTGKKLKKKDGTLRETHDASHQLKNLHEIINSRLLRKVLYPDFLNGSLPKRSIYTNAQFHTNKSILIAEDIANFFPSTTIDIVKLIWQRFFHFGPEIAEVLANLTTYKGFLPQGWKTSSYLANLVFWDLESELFTKLQTRGFVYSRYVDDIALSKQGNYSTKEVSEVISLVAGMFSKKGYRLKRTKHEIMTQSSRQLVTNQLVNNRTVGLPRENRRTIRSKVFKLEQVYAIGGVGSPIYREKWVQLAQLVGGLKRGHPKQYCELRRRLNAIRDSQ